MGPGILASIMFQLREKKRHAELSLVVKDAA